MNKQTPILFALLTIAIVVVFFLIYQRRQNETHIQPAETTSATTPATEHDRSLPPPTVHAPHEPAAPPPNGQPDRKSNLSIAPVNRDSRLTEPVSPADMTPFLKSEIADKWIRELGYTQADIVKAQKDIRSQGSDERLVNDPGVILRHLPPRHMGNVSVEDFTVPDEVRAGEPIPFTLKGTAPSPSFNFTHFDVLVQGSVIRIQARGNSDGDNESGLGGAFSESGQIDPLPAGTYSVEFPELGPKGSFPIIVRD